MPTWTPPNLEFGLASNGTGKAANASLPSSLRLKGIVLSFYPRVLTRGLQEESPPESGRPQHRTHAGADRPADVERRREAGLLHLQFRRSLAAELQRRPPDHGDPCRSDGVPLGDQS